MQEFQIFRESRKCLQGRPIGRNLRVYCVTIGLHVLSCRLCLGLGNRTVSFFFSDWEFCSQFPSTSCVPHPSLHTWRNSFIFWIVPLHYPTVAFLMNDTCLCTQRHKVWCFHCRSHLEPVPLLANCGEHVRLSACDECLRPRNVSMSNAAAGRSLNVFLITVWSNFLIV